MESLLVVSRSSYISNVLPLELNGSTRAFIIVFLMPFCMSEIFLDFFRGQCRPSPASKEQSVLAHMAQGEEQGCSERKHHKQQTGVPPTWANWF